jgi:hypothetical protein
MWKSYLDDTYTVSTNVWVRDISGFPESLEYMKSIVCKKENVDNVKFSQMEIAKGIKEKLDKRLKELKNRLEIKK